MTVPKILNQLEVFYGKQEPCWPSDPYLFLLWWYCGYPASDASCSKGWKELTGRIGTDPDAILAAPPAKLTAALKPGGMLPELRAERMKEVAARIKNEFDGDLRASLVGPITKIRKVLKSFPSIADPGADRILLFAGIQPVAAVPSNCTGVLERIRNGHEEKNYNASYRAAQGIIDSEVPATYDVHEVAAAIRVSERRRLGRPHSSVRETSQRMHTARNLPGSCKVLSPTPINSSAVSAHLEKV